MLSGITSSLPRISPSRALEAVRSLDLPSPKGALEELREKVKTGVDAVKDFAGGDLIREGRQFVDGVKEKISDPVLHDGVKRTARGVAYTHTAVSDLKADRNRVFTPDSPSDNRQGRADGQVRVTSWNLHHGTSPDSQGASNTLNKQIQEIKKSRSDVVLLQEVLPWQAEEIAKKSGMTGYYSQTTARQGNMILVDSSLKVVDDSRQTLNYDFQKGDSLEALKASWETKGDEPRAAQALTIERPDGKGEFTVFNTHLSTSNSTPQQRLEESLKFAQFVNQHSSGNVIGGGDLNMGRGNSMLDGFRQSGFTIEGGRIDHLLTRGVANSDITTNDPHSGETRLSDHPMVTGDYSLG